MRPEKAAVTLVHPHRTRRKPRPRLQFPKGFFNDPSIVVAHHGDRVVPHPAETLVTLAPAQLGPRIAEIDQAGAVVGDLVQQQATGNGIARGRHAVTQSLLLGRFLGQHVQADHAARARERAQVKPKPAALAGSAAVTQLAHRVALARRLQGLFQRSAVLLLQHAQEVLAHKLRRHLVIDDVEHAGKLTVDADELAHLPIVLGNGRRPGIAVEDEG